KGFKALEGLSPDANIINMPKYLFKKGDMDGELEPATFPFVLKQDTHFSIVDVKKVTYHFTVEIDGPKSYHVNYSCKYYSFPVQIAWNEEEKNVVSKAMMDEKTIEFIKQNKMSKQGLVDSVVNFLAKMIDC